ncbi:MAG: hypothetical protein ACR2PZ_07645 [Pseudomonadales bacterium]
MAYLTLSENIVAALITAADGVLTLQLGDALGQLDAWQQKHNCHFGTCRSDVSTSVHLLWFEDIALFNLCPTSSEKVDQLGLSEVLPVLLKYKHWYANDEASYWEKASTRHQADNKPPLQSTSFRSFKLRQYLDASTDRKSDQTLQILGKLGLGEKHLQSCARPGQSS